MPRCRTRRIYFKGSHITSVCKKVSSGIGVIKTIKPFIPSRSLINIYQSLVEPYFDYCSIVWNGISEGLVEKLQKLQNRGARIITGSHYMAPTKDMLEKLGWSYGKERRNKQRALMTLNKETTFFNLQNMFRHSHVIFSCKWALTVVHLNFRFKVRYKLRFKTYV